MKIRLLIIFIVFSFFSNIANGRSERTVKTFCESDEFGIQLFQSYNAIRNDTSLLPDTVDLHIDVRITFNKNNRITNPTIVDIRVDRVENEMFIKKTLRKYKRSALKDYRRIRKSKYDEEQREVRGHLVVTHIYSVPRKDLYTVEARTKR